MSNLDMVVMHLNASLGPKLSALELAAALRAGSLNVLLTSPAVAAAAAYFFVETEPRLIALCAYEAGTDIKQANKMYESLVAEAMPRVPTWEEAVKYYA